MDYNSHLARLPLAVRRPIHVPCGLGPRIWFGVLYNDDIDIDDGDHVYDLDYINEGVHVGSESDDEHVHLNVQVFSMTMTMICWR